jgi:hypothetical protein
VVSVRTPQTASGDAAMFLQMNILLFSKRSITGTLSCDFQFFVISTASTEVSNLIRRKRVLHFSISLRV